MTNDEFTRLVQFLGERFDGIDRRFDGIDHRFDGIDRRFTIVDRRFDDVNRQVEELRADVGVEFERVRGEMRGGFETLTTLLRDSHGSLDRRVRRLEGER
jgi:hypothetical protein